mmetsp:Transcript_590/g.1010  ORF Transcript_590/g.1010 Transcript_590/m.1010 type:complete len:703 (+) Transcript_590:2032-4140(+)
MAIAPTPITVSLREILASRLNGDNESVISKLFNSSTTVPHSVRDVSFINDNSNPLLNEDFLWQGVPSPSHEKSHEANQFRQPLRFISSHKLADTGSEPNYNSTFLSKTLSYQKEIEQKQPYVLSDDRIPLASLSTSKYDKDSRPKAIITPQTSSSPAFTMSNASMISAESMDRLQQLAQPSERNCWKVASPSRSERFLVPSKSRGSPQRGFSEWLKTNSEWQRQQQLKIQKGCEEVRAKELQEQGHPKLAAVMTGRLAELARSRELARARIVQAQQPANPPVASSEQSIHPLAQQLSPQPTQPQPQELLTGTKVFDRLALRGQLSAHRHFHQHHTSSNSHIECNSSKSQINFSPNNRINYARNTSPSPVRRARSNSPNVRNSGSKKLSRAESLNRTAHLHTSLDEVLSLHDARSGRSDRIRLQDTVRKGLAASRSRSLSREKERQEKQLLAERNGSPCERRVFQPILQASKTDEIMKKRNCSFEERTRRSVEDFLVKVEVYKRLHPPEVPPLSRSSSPFNTREKTPNGSMHMSAHSTHSVHSNSNNINNNTDILSHSSNSVNRRGRRRSKGSSRIQSVQNTRRNELDWISPPKSRSSSRGVSPQRNNSSINSIENSNQQQHQDGSGGSDCGEEVVVHVAGRGGFSFGRERRMLPCAVRGLYLPSTVSSNNSIDYQNKSKSDHGYDEQHHKNELPKDAEDCVQ